MQNMEQLRRPGRRPRAEAPWRACLLLEPRHRAAVEQRAAAEGGTISGVVRQLLDRALVPEVGS